MTPGNDTSWIDSFDYEALAFEMTVSGQPTTPEEARDLVRRIVMTNDRFERTMDMESRVKLISAALGEVLRNGKATPPKNGKGSGYHSLIEEYKQPDHRTERYTRRLIRRDIQTRQPTRIIPPVKKRKNPYGQKRTGANSDRGTPAQGNHSNG